MSSGSRLGPAYNIPNNIEDNITLVAGYTVKDTLAIISPILAFGYASMNLPPSLVFLQLPLVAGGIAASLFIVLFHPEHVGPADWVESIYHYFRTPKEIPHLSMATDEFHEEEVPATQVYEMESRTQDELHVKRIHKDANAIERPDGTVVAALKVESANMALASEDDWWRLVRNWQGYIDNTVDYPIQIYTTSSTFPANDYVSVYRARLGDPDMKSRPVLRHVTKSFAEWYPEYLNRHGTNTREFYIIIPVTEEEVKRDSTETETVVDRLSTKPVVGGLFQKISDARTEDMDEDQLKVEQLKTVNHRIQMANERGARQIPGCSGRQLTGAEFAVLLKEYWEGVEYDFGENAVRNHQSPVPRSDPVDPEEVEKGYSQAESRNNDE